MTNSIRLETEWLNHINSKFPRRVNTPKSEIVWDSQRYLYLIWRHLGLSPIWVGIYDADSIGIEMYNKIGLDLDHKSDLELVHMDTITLFNHFKQKYDREARLYFSGQKGFHVYLDFYPITAGINNFEGMLKIFVNELKKETGVTTIDRHCLERNRVLRLPFTPHETSKRWCIPINPEWSLTKILQESVYLEDCWNVDTEPKFGNDSIIEALRECRDKAMIKQAVPTVYPLIDSSSLDMEIEMLRELAPFVEDGRHRILHYMIVPRMVHAKYDIYQIHGFCKEWIDETGKSYLHYRDYVERSYYRNQQWRAWSFNKFFYEYPELALPLTEIYKKVKKRVNEREEN